MPNCSGGTKGSHRPAAKMKQDLMKNQSLSRVSQRLAVEIDGKGQEGGYSLPMTTSSQQQSSENYCILKLTWKEGGIYCEAIAERWEEEKVDRRKWELTLHEKGVLWISNHNCSDVHHLETTHHPKVTPTTSLNMNYILQEVKKSKWKALFFFITAIAFITTKTPNKLLG